MAGPQGAGINVGRAAALIAVAVLVGFVVLRHDGSRSSAAASAAAARAAAVNRLFATTTTTEAASSSRAATTTTLAARTPSTVKVIAINATNTAGIAGRVTTKLQQAGYNALQAGNATASVKASHPASVVYYTAGYEREAAAVATVVGLPASAVRPLPTTSPSPDIKPDANVVVLVGTGISA